MLKHLSTLAAGLLVSLAAWAVPTVEMTTSLGKITIELNPEKAPKTVEMFLYNADHGFYDGTIFHRVIGDFMIQGGGFTMAMEEKKTLTPALQNESTNGLANERGTIAMARTSDPNSASAQFFINVKDNAFLDPVLIPPGDPVPRFEYQGRVYENVARAQLLNATQLYGYTVFGKVVSGMDVINKIKAMPTGPGGSFPSDVPKTVYPYSCVAFNSCARATFS